MANAGESSTSDLLNDGEMPSGETLEAKQLKAGQRIVWYLGERSSTGRWAYCGVLAFVSLSLLVNALDEHPDTAHFVVAAGCCGISVIALRAALGGIYASASVVKIRTLFATLTLKWPEIERFELVSVRAGQTVRVYLRDGQSRTFQDLRVRSPKRRAEAGRAVEELNSLADLHGSMERVG